MKYPELVIVHLGMNFPRFLKKNLNLIKLNFPYINLHLIVSEGTKPNAQKNSNYSVYHYIPDIEVEEALSSMVLDEKFRQGYWRYTLERLFAISQLHQKCPSKSFLHIESDILMLPSFPFDKFDSLDTIHWLGADPDKDVASLMYFPNSESSKIFKDDLLGIIHGNPMITDMKALKLMRSCKPKQYQLLPSASFSRPQVGIFAQSEVAERERILTEHFGGIFDPAVYGMWLTGIDPRNNFGLTSYLDSSRITESESFARPFEFQFSFDGHTLLLDNELESYSLFNLHIHTKSSKLLSTKYRIGLYKLVRKSRNAKKYTKFNLSILIQLLFSNTKNRTLLAFLLHIPVIKKLRKKNLIFDKA